MLSEVCRYLNNWFDCARYYGRFEIAGGVLLSFNDGEILQDGQYFRIIDSVFNDGVHKYPDDVLKDEIFEGAVWVLKIPPEVIAISGEIDEWTEKYLSVGDQALSPYTSESFGGYSYTKGATENGVGGSWESVAGFTSRLNGWRKPRCRY